MQAFKGETEPVRVITTWVVLLEAVEVKDVLAAMIVSKDLELELEFYFIEG